MPQTASLSDPETTPGPYDGPVPETLDLVRGFVTLALALDAGTIDAIVELERAKDHEHAATTARTIEWAAGRG